MLDRHARLPQSLCRQLDHGLAATRTEHIGSAALKLRFPRGNLIGMYVELLGKLRQCPIALDGGKRSGYGALTA